MINLEDCLRQGTASAAQLTAALKISQPTLSRKIKDSANVLKIGQGKSTRYALLRSVGAASRFPLYQINQAGQVTHISTLYPIWPGDACAVESVAGEWRCHDGLPWYLNDMRPQGFLGRVWGNEIAEKLDLPEDIRLWTERHTLLALAQWGDAAVGALMIGEGSYQRFFDREPDFRVSLRDKTETYLHLAALSLAGEQVGSSAGGEQPKFGCLTEHDGKGYLHALVKFSLGAANDNAERWADLLQAEALALDVLRRHGVSASEAQILFATTGEIFLEVQRFDRIGLNGRAGMISLESVAAEFLGQRAVNWVDSAKALQQLGIIDSECVERISLIYAFGKLIANSDMHPGNLSFLNPLQRPLRLAPVYDMLPMAFAPVSSGSMRHGVVEIKLEPQLGKACWSEALAWAIDYWQAVSDCETISGAFRQLASEMLAQVTGLTATISRFA